MSPLVWKPNPKLDYRPPLRAPGIAIAPSGTPIWPPLPGYLKIRSTDLLYEIVVLLDDDAEPMLTPGAARIEKTDMLWRSQATHWAGQENDTLEVEIIVDAYPFGNIERVLSELDRMARPRKRGVASGGPKPVEIAGQSDGTDMLWWPPKITPGKAIWRNGHRVRKRYTLLFEEYRPLDKIEAKSRKNQRSSKGALVRRPSHKVVAGESLASIARDQLGQASRWKDIAKLNPRRSGKKKIARRSSTDVKVGEVLKMPQD